MAEKVLKPEEIEDAPLPGQTNLPSYGSLLSGGDTRTQEKIKDNSTPPVKRAYEVISSSLNTNSRKILAEFEFTERGALQIGKYIDGVSGDVRITPNGITSRDSNGDTTFSIDGTTGDAIFKGEVRASDFIVADETGLVSLSNFKSGTVSASDPTSILLTIGVPLYLMSLVTPKFNRETVCLVIFTCQNQIYSKDSNPFAGAVWYVLVVDGVQDQSMYMTNYGENDPGTSWAHDGIGWRTSTMHFLTTLPPGEHVIEIWWGIQNVSGGGRATTYARTLSFTTMGS